MKHEMMMYIAPFNVDVKSFLINGKKNARSAGSTVDRTTTAGIVDNFCNAIPSIYAPRRPPIYPKFKSNSAT
jgi:hypothetical protein